MDRPFALSHNRTMHADGGSEARILRDRHERLLDAIDRLEQPSSAGAARQLVQIYDGGSMPTLPDHIYVCHPVQLDGTESEGSSASPVVDSSTTLYVDVLWHAPTAGDILVATLVGGRWVAERTVSGPTGFGCGACSIPEKNLTLSWTNSLIGNGSTTLTYSGSPVQWESACTNGLLYLLLCTGNQVEFRVIYFTSGVCPTGQQVYCSTLGSNPQKLTQTGLTCGSSFLLTCTCDSTGCPQLAGNGYSAFSVSA